MTTLEGPTECYNCGCNLYEHCEGYEGGKMSNKMLMAQDSNYQLYFETDDAEHIYLEIDNPEHFEVSNLYIKIQIPLDKWNNMAKDYREKYFRHFKDDSEQMELKL